ncbi:GNAT family N-acetyltransferase [Clavibacter zhangzhiyongii]|uniref:GNAT family N-acetyltransferase n=1 Tax=Clavibacter zhangzhiyongii TaxID=2768071 RepID=UPI0039E188F1
MHCTIDRVAWDDEDAVLLRAAQRAELDLRYGGDTEPGTKPTAADVAVFLVARDADGTPVGCGGIRPLARPPGRGVPWAELKRMYVVPAARGTGVATAVLRALEDAARDLGVVDLVLETGHEQPDAMRFYAARGLDGDPPLRRLRRIRGLALLRADARVSRPLRLIRLLALSSHPGPTATVTVLAAGLAVALGYGPGRVVAVALAVLLGQLSIGLSNDWIDADRDRSVGRGDKPVARGEVTVAQVRAAALGTAAACLVASAALGPAFLLAHVVLVGSGWAYNAGLKRTAVSVVPFVVAFGILPTVVALGAADPVPAAAWATVTGAVLGVSIHFTNVLPDLDDDARGRASAASRTGSAA